MTKEMNEKDYINTVKPGLLKQAIAELSSKDFHTQTCISFTENWERILFDSRYKLTSTELKIMFFVMNRMSSGNLFTLTQKTIAKETGIDQSNISRAFSSLVKKGILIKYEGNSYYFNSNLSVKK